jgi:hypothetical protein
VTFSTYGETVKIPRNENVEVHVRKVILNPGIPDQAIEVVEVREYLKSGEIYGNGLVVPVGMIKDLKVALDRVTRAEKVDWAK